MNATRKFTNIALILLLAGSLTAAGCAGGPLTTREKGAGLVHLVERLRED